MMHHHPRFTDTLLRLEATKFDYRKTSLSRDKGEFIWNLIRENNYQKTIEIGCALGVSSLYICDAISESDNPAHTIVDPNQTSGWASIGTRNLEERNISFFTLIEEPSEIALPKLLEKKQIFDFGLIDGWHTFDHTLIDFFYLNRLTKVGGMIVIDDANWPSISKLLKYLIKYPSYELILDSKDRTLYLVDDLLDPNKDTLFPAIVGLKKVADDQRRWDWYEPF